ncbi:MAG: hypothetical protein ACOVRN_08795, partial [Flavobacterium sp.]
ETKELNTLTNRCVNKCKPEYSRDLTTGKCKKNVTKRNVTENKCPETKELNTLTNRCVNKCKPGYGRNANFKCEKI